MNRPINYKMNPNADSKAAFKMQLKYGECSCGNVMWCKWSCSVQTYPVGMRHYEHPLWKEIATVYLEALREGHYDLSDEWTQELIRKLREYEN